MVRAPSGHVRRLVSAAILPKNNASYYNSTDEKLNACAFYPAVSVAAVGYQTNV